MNNGTRAIPSCPTVYLAGTRGGERWVNLGEWEGGRRRRLGFSSPAGIDCNNSTSLRKLGQSMTDCRSCWNHPTTFYGGLFGRYKCWERAIAMSLIQMGLSANQIAAELKPSVCQLNPPLFSHWKSKYFGLASRSGAFPIFQNPSISNPAALPYLRFSSVLIWSYRQQHSPPLTAANILVDGAPRLATRLPSCCS